MKLILLGAPGAGKGTQAEYIKAALGVPVISTGNLLREAIAQGTPLGQQAKSYMDGGQLVPDELIIGLVEEKLHAPECEHGAIFDGFPRTVAQAETLDNMAGVDVALSIEVPDEAIVHRMAGRRTCPKCHATYHIEGNPPKVEGICDKCGTPAFATTTTPPSCSSGWRSIMHRPSPSRNTMPRWASSALSRASARWTRSVSGSLRRWSSEYDQDQIAP